VTRSPPANDEKTSDFVTKFVNMGAATGSSIFFSGRKCDKSKQKKRDTWLCQLALSKYRVPTDCLSSASLLFDGHNWEPMGTPLDTPNFPQILVHQGPPAHHLAGFCHLPGLAEVSASATLQAQMAQMAKRAMPAESEASGICRYLEKFRKQLQKTTSTTTW
jgi:hypothetical protein